MKKRIISALIVLAIIIPLTVIGGLVFKLSILFIGIIGLKELLNMYKNKLPKIIEIISYIMLTLIILFNTFNNKIEFTINYSLLFVTLLSLFTPLLFLKNKSKYNIVDAIFLFGMIMFLGIAFNIFILLRNYNLKYIILLFLITIATDTYAYISGILIGKNKLCPKISPKKSVEGLIIGTIFGTLIASTYYYMYINDSINIIYLLLSIMLLSLLGQLGDLFFSAFKRHFKKKDFSNIMPGHGGVLDRLDSAIFVAYGLILLSLL